MKKAARTRKKSIAKPAVTEVIEKAEEVVEEVVATVTGEEVKKPHIMKKYFSKKSVQIGSFIAFAALIVVILVVYNWTSNNKVSLLPNGKVDTAAEIKDLVSEVGDKMVLPGETPTLATVSDVAKLQSQAFFKDAQNGDKVLIFPMAKLAVLYRQSIHKIIAVAPVNLPSPAPQTQDSSQSATLTPTTSPNQKLKVAVLNSTKTPGLAKKGGDLLKATADVIATSNATGEYDTTIVANVSNNKVTDSEVKSLLPVFSKISAKIGNLPVGETAPAGADVVIILGKDFASSY